MKFIVFVRGGTLRLKVGGLTFSWRIGSLGIHFFVVEEILVVSDTSQNYTIYTLGVVTYCLHGTICQRYQLRFPFRSLTTCHHILLGRCYFISVVCFTQYFPLVLGRSEASLELWGAHGSPNIYYIYTDRYRERSGCWYWYCSVLTGNRQ